MNVCKCMCREGGTALRQQSRRIRKLYVQKRFVGQRTAAGEDNTHYVRRGRGKQRGTTEANDGVRNGERRRARTASCARKVVGNSGGQTRSWRHGKQWCTGKDVLKTRTSPRAGRSGRPPAPARATWTPRPLLHLHLTRLLAHGCAREDVAAPSRPRQRSG